MHEANSASSTPFLGSQELCSHLLMSFSGGPDMFPSIPSQDVVASILLPLILVIRFLTLSILIVGSVYSTNMGLMLLIRPFCLIQSLFKTKSESVQLLLTPVLFHSFWAIPCDSLGLSMSYQEFVCSLQYWLGVFTCSPVHCPCGSIVDQSPPLLWKWTIRIRIHDALCDVIYNALPQDNTDCCKEQLGLSRQHLSP